MELPAADTTEFVLFGMRFDGSEFDWWSACMLDVLTHLDQASPLQGLNARRRSMFDSASEDMDELACSMIGLHLIESINCIVHACITRDLWEALYAMYKTTKSRHMSRARGSLGR